MAYNQEGGGGGGGGGSLILGWKFDLVFRRSFTSEIQGPAWLKMVKNLYDSH